MHAMAFQCSHHLTIIHVIFFSSILFHSSSASSPAQPPSPPPPPPSPPPHLPPTSPLVLSFRQTIHLDGSTNAYVAFPSPRASCGDDGVDTLSQIIFDVHTRRGSATRAGALRSGGENSGGPGAAGGLAEESDGLEGFVERTKGYGSASSRSGSLREVGAGGGLLLYADDGGVGGVGGLKGVTGSFLQLKLLEEGRTCRLRMQMGEREKVAIEAPVSGRRFRVIIRRLAMSLSSDDVMTSSAPARHVTMVSLNGSTLLVELGVRMEEMFKSLLYLGGVPTALPPLTTKQGADKHPHHRHHHSFPPFSLESVQFEPRLEASLGNVTYTCCHDTMPGCHEEKVVEGVQWREGLLEVVASAGTRVSTEDLCLVSNPCVNYGRCVSTDRAPVCDCERTEFTGSKCHIRRELSVVTLFGQEFLSFVMNTSIISRRDQISFYFQTAQQSALLLYASGDGDDFTSVVLHEGVLFLKVRIGSGTFETEIRQQQRRQEQQQQQQQQQQQNQQSQEHNRFDDQMWHHVIITRESREVTIQVDDAAQRTGTVVGDSSMTSLRSILIGGVEDATRAPETQSSAYFQGCIKQFIFTSDDIYVDVIAMTSAADNVMTSPTQLTTSPNLDDAGASTTSLFRVVGRVLWGRCEELETVLPLTFAQSSAFLRLPVWVPDQSGSRTPGDQGGSSGFGSPDLGGSSRTFEFKFRTVESESLVVCSFIRGNDAFQDGRRFLFFAFFVITDVLHFIINTSSGASTQVTSFHRVTDGRPHHVKLTLRGINQLLAPLSVTVDENTVLFNSSIFTFESWKKYGGPEELPHSRTPAIEIYLGGIDFTDFGFGDMGEGGGEGRGGHRTRGGGGRARGWGEGEGGGGEGGLHVRGFGAGERGGGKAESGGGDGGGGAEGELGGRGIDMSQWYGASLPDLPGFLGCMHDVRVGEDRINLISLVRSQGGEGLRTGCHRVEGYCEHEPCQHGGMCREGWMGFTCDCTRTGYTGDHCQQEAVTLRFNGAQYFHWTLTHDVSHGSDDQDQGRRVRPTRAVDLTLRVRTKLKDSFILSISTHKTTSLSSSSSSSSSYMNGFLELSMADGHFIVDYKIGSEKKQSLYGSGPMISDDKWHSVFIRHRTNIISLSVDNHRPAIANTSASISSEMFKILDVGLPSTSFQDDDFPLSSASSLSSSKFSSSTSSGSWASSASLSSASGFKHSRIVRSANSGLRNTFEGLMQRLVYNGEELFEKVKKADHRGRAAIESSADQIDNSSPISISTSQAYLITDLLLQPDTSSIYFKFKTVEAYGLILYASVSQEQRRGEDEGGRNGGIVFFAIELSGGHLRYVYDWGSGPRLLRVGLSQPLSDSHWHDVTARRLNATHTYLRVDNVTKWDRLHGGGVAVKEGGGGGGGGGGVTGVPVDAAQGTVSQSDARSHARAGKVNVYVEGFDDGHAVKVKLYVGGADERLFASLPKQIRSTHGFQGCLAMLDVDGDNRHLLEGEDYAQGQGRVQGQVQSRASVPFEYRDQIKNGCGNSKSECTSESCDNNGFCLQSWDSFSCQCDLTSFSGPTCSDDSIAYRFITSSERDGGGGAEIQDGGSERRAEPNGGVEGARARGGGIIRFTYPRDHEPERRNDVIALGFSTTRDTVIPTDAVLLRIDGKESGTDHPDYLQMELIDGSLFVTYNLGMADHRAGSFEHKVNDGHYHVVRFSRNGPNSTLNIDDLPPQRYLAAGHQQSVFNSQSTISLGGIQVSGVSGGGVGLGGGIDLGERKSARVERPFHGLLAGVVVNGLRLLDLASEGDGRIELIGEIQLDNKPIKLHPSLSFLTPPIVRQSVTSLHAESLMTSSNVDGLVTSSSSVMITTEGVTSKTTKKAAGLQPESRPSTDDLIFSGDDWSGNGCGLRDDDDDGDDDDDVERKRCESELKRRKTINDDDEDEKERDDNEDSDSFVVTTTEKTTHKAFSTTPSAEYRIKTKDDGRGAEEEVERKTKEDEKSGEDEKSRELKEKDGEPCDIDNDDCIYSSGDDDIMMTSTSSTTKTSVLSRHPNVTSIDFMTSVARRRVASFVTSAPHLLASTNSTSSSTTTMNRLPTSPLSQFLGHDVATTTRTATEDIGRRSHEYLSPTTSNFFVRVATLGAQAGRGTRPPPVPTHPPPSPDSVISLIPSGVNRHPEENLVPPDVVAAAATDLRSLTMNIILIIGIAIAVVVLLAMLVFIICRFHSRRTGARVAETKVYLPGAGGRGGGPRGVGDDGDKLVVRVYGGDSAAAVSVIGGMVGGGEGGGGGGGNSYEVEEGANRKGEVKEWFV